MTGTEYKQDTELFILAFISQTEELSPRCP